METKKTDEAEYTCAQRHVRTAGLNGAAGLFGGKLTELCANRQDGYAEGESLDGQIPIMEVLKTIVRAAQVSTLSGSTLRLTLSPLPPSRLPLYRRSRQRTRTTRHASRAKPAMAA